MLSGTVTPIARAQPQPHPELEPQPQPEPQQQKQLPLLPPSPAINPIFELKIEILDLNESLSEPMCDHIEILTDESINNLLQIKDLTLISCFEPGNISGTLWCFRKIACDHYGGFITKESPIPEEFLKILVGNSFSLGEYIIRIVE